jgi:hypothetical protein
VKCFYCYDNRCYLACLAALCGCPTIIPPLENETIEEYIKNNPQTKYGIAVGIENFKHAQETLPLVQKNYQQVKKEEFETIKKFIKMCEEKFIKNEI